MAIKLRVVNALPGRGEAEIVAEIAEAEATLEIMRAELQKALARLRTQGLHVWLLVADHETGKTRRAKRINPAIKAQSAATRSIKLLGQQMAGLRRELESLQAAKEEDELDSFK